MEENKENITEEKENTEKTSKNPNKLTIFEILVFLILVIGVIVYASPNFLLNADKRKSAQVQTNANIFVSKALAEFSSDKKVKASVVAAKLAEELNSVNKNPYSKKIPAYSVDKDCKGCVIIQSDDKVNSMTVSAYSEDGVLLVRTLIQPPSYVTYTRDLDEKSKDKEKK